MKKLILFSLIFWGSLSAANTGDEVEIKNKIKSQATLGCTNDIQSIVDAVVESQNESHALAQAREKLRKSITDQAEVNRCLASIDRALIDIEVQNAGSGKGEGIISHIKGNLIAFFSFVAGHMNKPGGACDGPCPMVIVNSGGIRG
jgi:hypothetical protein